MVPQQVPFYSPALASGAPPGYGQSGFYPSNPVPQAHGLPVQVGIPAGVPVFGAAVQQTFAHVANAGGGNVPFSTGNQQTHFVQGAQQNNFVQGVPPNNSYAAPSDANMWQGQPRASSPPPPSSFPPGFEPSHKNNLAMGFPSQPRPNAAAIGDPVVHLNQHHAHYQHEHVHQQYQHPQQQDQHPQQYQHQQQHQPLPQHQYQHPKQQQQQQQQQQHQHQHPHHHQHQQNQHLNQHQHHHQHEHQRQHRQQHQVQQHDHYQRNEYPHMHSQHQMQAQQYQNPHGHSHHQLQLQAQHSVQPQNQPQPQTQLLIPPQPAHFQSGPQSQSQAQQPCQQVQLIPSPFGNSLNAYASNIQADCANGVAIGVPVMPTSSHVDITASQTLVQIQQPTPAWQPGCPENLLQCTPQDNGSQAIRPKKDQHLNGWRSTPIQRNDYSSAERQKDPQEYALVKPRMNPDPQFHAEATKPSDAQGLDRMQSNGHSSRPSCFRGNDNQRWLSPPKSQMLAWGNGRNPLHVFKGLQPHSNGQLKSHMNGQFAVAVQKCSNSQRMLQQQRPYDFGGNKDVQRRSAMQPIRCDPCDRTFNSSEILASHLKTHVKCSEDGCTFEASGKILKEHKATEHGKAEFQATSRGRKALVLWSMEDKEDIKRWREERKRSYPTSANILRKAENRKRMDAEGEVLDEESQKRRQRMRDVIAKQKQLGYQVPEIPSHYFHTRHDRRPKKMARDETAIVDATDGKTEFVERRNLVGLKRTADDMQASHDGAMKVNGCKNNNEPSNDAPEYPRRGYTRQGHQSKFMSQHEGRKHHQNYDNKMAQPRPRPPTLLAKLLHDDIQKENSYLLQCCRFIVNNGFFQDYSPTSLKHFEWIVAAMPGCGDGSSVDVIDSKAQRKLEMGEDVPNPSNSEISACRDGSTMLSDSRESVLEAENKVIDMEGFDTKADMETEDATHVPAASPRKRGRKNQEQDAVHEERPGGHPSQPCCKNDAGKVEPKVGSADCQSTCKHPDACLESNNPQSKSFAVGKVVSSVNTSLSSWKPTNTSTEVSYSDVEAGEVVSEQSESVVEDEEDIAQYMNFDVNGADSGSCYN